MRTYFITYFRSEYRLPALLVLLLTVALPAMAASNYEILSADGEGDGDGFGYLVTSGDVNGDGYDDIVVNGRYTGPDGKVYVYFGGPAVDNTPDVTMTQAGPYDGNHFGSSLSLGDVNGDGYLDVVVGAQYYDEPGLGSGDNRGAIFIFHGGPTIDATVDLLIPGPHPSYMLGSAVSACGDVNGDGYDDVVAGAMDTRGWVPGRGYVIPGGSPMAPVIGSSFGNYQSSDQFGSWVSHAGDVNGDGYDDFLMGANRYDAGLTDNGRFWLFFGGSSYDNVADLTFDGEATDDKLTFAGGVGDVNGDGYDDFVISSIYHDGVGTDSGRAYLHLGGATPDNVPDLVLDGESAGDYFGFVSSRAGDIDGDGYADFLLGGIEREAGRAYLYRGAPSPDAHPDLVFDGDPAYPRFGHGSAMGDIDGNGSLDLVISAAANDPGRLYAFEYVPNIVCGPTPLEINLADDLGGGIYGEALAVSYLGGSSGDVFGYSIDLTWDPAVVTAAANDFAKPDTGPFASAPFFFAQIVSPGVARIDAALLGTTAGSTGDDLFQVIFTAAEALDWDRSDLILTLNSIRDAYNVPLTEITSNDGEVIVDVVAPVVSTATITNTTLAHTDDYLKNNDAVTVTATVTDGDPAFGTEAFSADLSGLGGNPAAVAGSYAAGEATWIIPNATCDPANGTVTVTVSATDGLGNSSSDDDTIISDNTAPTAVSGFAAAPGHKKVDLSWNDAAGQDTYYAGLVIRYTAWGDYADYATSAPEYPDGPASGDGEVFDGTGAAATHVFASDDRDIYYYAAYIYDEARNYSPLEAGSRDRATNYWLGDVGVGDYTGPYDGQVSIADLTGLGSTYGLDEGDTGWKSECDVGPTDDLSRTGIPVPDNHVQFEDLMIFAMNSGVVSDKTFERIGTSEPSLVWAQTDERTWTLTLSEPCANLKGVNVAFELPAGSASVSRGGLLLRQDATVFLQNIDSHGLDAGLAILGQGLGIEGSGELLRVTLVEAQDLSEAVIMARGTANEYFGSAPMVPVPEIPVVRYNLAQNTPNPFNPQTKIVFSLPDRQSVRLAVYTLDGRRVRQLLNEVRGSGVHDVIWNGRDDGGRQVASGTYVYRLQAGSYIKTRKMSLMK